MQFYVFRLEDRSAKTFQGIVVIFGTQPQDVWKKLVTDSRGERVPGTVASSEATKLDAELTALTQGMEVRKEPTLLRQMFDDPVFGKDIRAVFAGRDQFTSISPDEHSFRIRVDKWYEKTKL